MAKLIYLIGSLKNPEVPVIANRLRAIGFNVFDDWHRVGPDADDYWRTEEKDAGRTYAQALAGPSAQNTFNFDKVWLDKCDIGVLIMPAGKSAHLELGYLRGLGKPAYIVFDQEPERWDVMVNFATKVFTSFDGLRWELINREGRETPPGPSRRCNYGGDCYVSECVENRRCVMQKHMDRRGVGQL